MADWTPPKGATAVSDNSNGWQPPSGAEVVDDPTVSPYNDETIVQDPPGKPSAPGAGTASPSTLVGGSAASVSSVPGQTQWQPEPMAGVQLPETALSNDAPIEAPAQFQVTRQEQADSAKRVQQAQRQREDDLVRIYQQSSTPNDGLYQTPATSRKVDPNLNVPLNIQEQRAALEARPVTQMGGAGQDDIAASIVSDPRRVKLYADYERYMQTTDPEGYAAYERDRRERIEAGAWTPKQDIEHEFKVLEHQRKALEGQRIVLERAAKSGVNIESLRPQAEQYDGMVELLREQYTELAARDPRSFQDKVNERAQAATDVLAEFNLAGKDVLGASGESFVQGGGAVMGNAMVGIARLIDTGDGYSFSDRFADYIGDVRKSNATGIASKYKDTGDGLTATNFLPKLAEGAGSMAALIAPGILSGGASTALGAGASTSSAVGNATMMGVTYASEYESYVQQAIEGGASEEAAENAGHGYALMSTLIERFNPQAGAIPGAKSAIKNVFIDGAKKGLSDKAIVANALLEFSKQGGKEAAEEVSQALAERATNAAVNDLTGTNLEETLRFKEAADGAVIGFVLGALGGAGQAVAQRGEFSRAQAEAVKWAASNPQQAKESINNTTLTDEQKQEAGAKIDELSSIYKGNNLTEQDPKTALEVAQNTLRKNELLNDQKENPTDPTIAEAGGDPRQAEIEAIDAANLKALGLKLEEETEKAPNPAPKKAAVKPKKKDEVERKAVDDSATSEGADVEIRPGRKPDATATAKAPDAEAAPGVPPQEPAVEPKRTERQKAKDRRAERDSIIKEAASAGADAMGIRGQVLQYFIGDNNERKGRVGTESLIKELGLRDPTTGKTGEGLRRLISMHGKDGPTIQALAEQIAQNPDGARPFDEQEVRDEIIDVLSTYSGRAEMIEGLRELLPSTKEAKYMDDMMRSAAYDDDVQSVAEELGVTDDDILAAQEQEAADFDTLTDDQKDAYFQRYAQEEADAPAGATGSAPVSEGVLSEDEGEAAERDYAARLSEREAKLNFDKKTLANIEADFNERGMSLFSEDDGSAAPGMFGDTRQNERADYERMVAPMRAQVAKSQKALDDFVAGKEKFIADRVRAARAQSSIGDDNMAASTGSRARGRIPVSPIAGDVRKRTQVLKDLGKGVGRTVQFGKPNTSRRGVLGTYAPSSAQVRIRYAGDLDTTAHEIGHALDDAFGLTTDLMNSIGGLMEVRQLAQFGSKPPKGSKDPRRYEAQEGVAEYVRALVVNPDQTRTMFPAMTEAYDRLLSAEAKAAIDKFSEDVRSFAGATGADMVMSNIQTDPTKSKSQVLKKLFAKEDGFTISFADQMKANWVDPLTAFKKAQEYAQQIGEPAPLSPSKDPYLLARLLLHNGGKTSEVLSSGMITSRNKLIVDENGVAKNLDWLMAPFDASSKESVHRDMNDTIALMVAERTIELAGKLGRADILTGIGGGIFADVEVAEKTIWELTQDPERAARLQDGAKRYREMATHVLEYLRDKGRISNEQFDLITQNNVQYVALQRVMEAAPDEPVVVFTGDGNALASVKTPVKSIKGSSRTIKDPYGSLLDGINKSIKEADRNEVMLAFTDLLRSDRTMGEGEPINFAEIGALAKAGDKNTITVFKNGKAEHWRFKDDIYKALKGLDDEGYVLPSIMRAPAAVLRWTVTHFPVFAARNIVRDMQSRMILSNSYGVMDTATMKPLRDLVGNKEHWRDVAVAGGLNSGYYLKDDVHYYGLMNEAVDRMRKDKRFIIADPGRWGSVWKAYEDALYKSESLNRVAEYRAAFRDAKEQGMDDYNAQLHAAFKASDLIDFALAGHHARVLNQVVPFSNAMIQGLRSAMVSAQANPAAFTARIALYSILPSVLVWLLGHGDEDDEKEYAALPAYQRDMFYNIKIAPDTWVSIPKPFELGLPGAFVDRAMSAANGEEGSFDGYAGSVLHSFLPDEAAIAGPGRIGVELLANYDFFRNKPIVPPHEDKLNLAYRNTEASSRVGQIMQDAFGADARKFDHAIKSQFSYFGNTALKLGDIGKEDSRNKFGLSDLGFFKNSPAYNSAVVTDLTLLASEHGLTNTREYKAFRMVADEYFTATGAKEKDAAAKRLRDTADKLLPFFEKLSEAKMAAAAKEKKE
jgi:hypothetical protein